MLCCAALPFLPAVPAARAGALEDYVGKPDTGFKWEQTGQQSSPDVTLIRLKLVSQQWREHRWTHDLVVVRPASPRNPHVAFLLISADGKASLVTAAGHPYKLSTEARVIPDTEP